MNGYLDTKYILMMDVVCCFVRGDVSVLYLYSQNYNTFDYNLMIINDIVALITMEMINLI